MQLGRGFGLGCGDQVGLLHAEQLPVGYTKQNIQAQFQRGSRYGPAERWKDCRIMRETGTIFVDRDAVENKMNSVSHLNGTQGLRLLTDTLRLGHLKTED